MKALYRLHVDWGRAGDVEGLFIAEKKEVEDAIGKEVYFGEILGKHSEIYGELEEKDVEMLCDDQKFISQVEKYIGGGTLSGYNPLEYLWEDEDGQDE